MIVYPFKVCSQKTGKRLNKRAFLIIDFRYLVVKLLCELFGSLGIDVSVVLLTAGDVLRLVALQRLHVEDVAEAAAVGARDAFNANVELAAVGGVSVARVVTWLLNLRWVGANEALGYLQLIAALHEVSPDADPLLVVVSKARRAFVLAALAVPARVENAAVGGMLEDAVKTRAVGRAYRWFQIGSRAAVYGEGVGAVLAKGIRVIERKSVAADLKGGRAVLAGPVLVTGLDVRIEAKAIGALEAARRGAHRRGLSSGRRGGLVASARLR